MRLSILFILSLFIISCSLFNSDSENKTSTPIARVGDEFLYVDDIQEVLPQGVKGADSVLIIDNYIQSWIKEKLILQKAELNLNEYQKDFKKQLEDYRKSLIIYTYEKEYIKQNLDTNVSDAEIKEYYEKNKQNFELKEDIVKVRYLKLLKSAPKIKQVRKLYASDKKQDIENLKELAHQYSEKFHLDDSLWISFQELKKEVPLKVNQTEGYLKNIKKIEVEDSLSYYFVKIRDYKLKNDVSPMSFEAHNIKNIIINKRKLNLINKIKTELYQEAFLNKQIEIYKPKNDKQT